MRNMILCYFLIFSFSVCAQDFEGEIKYKLSYYQKDNETPIESPELIRLFGDTSIFITKKGSYKQVTNSQYMAYQLYDPLTNRLYLKSQIESDTLFYIIGSKIKNTKFEYEITKNAVTILGYICDKLTVKDDIGKQDYYYTKHLKVSPKYFRNFSAFNKNEITDIMKSIFLRVDYFFIDFIARMEAVAINSGNVTNKHFVLPAHKILIEK